MKLSALISLMAFLFFAACQSEKTPAKTEASKPEISSQTQTTIPSVAIPSEFVIEMNEKSEIRIGGKLVAFDDFDEAIAKEFVIYKAAGAKKMPPLKIELNGETVGMGARAEVRTIYDETASKFEN